MNKKETLENAIEYEYSKSIVKDFFKEYEDEYKRLRNPSKEQTEEYRDTYFNYLDYMSKRLKWKNQRDLKK